MIKLSVCVALALVACSKKSASSSDDCATVIPAAVDRMFDATAAERQDAPKVALKAKLEMAPKLAAALTKSCNDDKWSAEVLACFRDAKSVGGLQTCEAKLTPEQN